jgi:hypothetical protein
MTERAPRCPEPARRLGMFSEFTTFEQYISIIFNEGPPLELCLCDPALMELRI